MGAWGTEWNESDQGLDAIAVDLEEPILNTLARHYVDTVKNGWVDTLNQIHYDFMELRAVLIASKRMLAALDYADSDRWKPLFEKCIELIDINKIIYSDQWKDPEKYITTVNGELKEVRDWIASWDD